MNIPVHVLFIEDNPGDARLVREQLSLNGQASATRLTWVDRLAKGLEYLPGRQVDAILLDLSLPDSHGLETLQRVLEAAPAIPVIVMTGTTDENLALQAVQAGAQDYLIKGQVDGGLLTRAIRYAIERKRVELQMRELAAIVEHSEDVIFRKDLDGTIRSWNRGAEQLYGYRPEEVIGRPVSILIPPEHLDRMDQIMTRIRRGEKVEYIETERIRKDGGHVTVSLKVSPIRNEQDSIIAASVLARDITEKKRAEEALKNSELRVNNILSRAAEAIIVVNEQQEITLFNHSAEKVFGWSEAEILGRPLSLLIPQRFAEIHHRHIRNFAGSPEGTRDMESRQMLIGVRRDGSEFAGMIGISKHVENGQMFFTAIVQDITEKKQAEEAVQQMRDRFQALTEHAPDGVALVDIHQRMQFVSPAGRRMFGYSQQEQIEIDSAEHTHPEDLPEVISALSRLIEDPAYIPTLQYRFRHRDGSWRWIESTFTNLLELKSIQAIVINFRDITERKQAEDALRESEKRFRSLIENGSDMVSILAADGRLLYESPSTNPMLGYQLGEFTGKSLFQLIHPEDLERVQVEFNRLIHNPGLHPRQQFRLRHCNGSWRWVDAVGTNLLADPSVSGIVVNYHDITDRKKADEELKRLNERFLLATRAADLGIWDWDIENNDLFWDDQMYTLYGLRRDQFSGAYQAWLNGLHPDDRARADETVRQALDGYGVFDHEFRVVWPDGSIHHLRWVGEVVFGEQGYPLRMTGVNYDITERKQAEQALRRSEQRFRALIENNAEAIALLGKDGTILFESPAATRILGFEADEMVGRNALELVHPQDRPAAAALMGSLLQTPGAVASTEVRYRRKDGAFCWVEATGSNLLEEPSVQAIVVNYRDVSGRKSLEHEIRERMKELTCLYRVQQDLPEDMPLDELCERTMIHLIQGMQFPDQAAVRIDLNGKQYASARYSPALVQVLTAGIHLDDQPVGSLSVYYTSDSLSSLPEEASMVESVARSIGKWLTQEQAQAALRKSEQQYRSLFEDSPVSLWLEDFSAVKERLDVLKQMGVADIRAYLHENLELVWECASLVRILDVNSAAMKVYHARHKEDLLGSLVDILPHFALDHFISELDLIAGGRLNFEWEQIDHTLTGNKIYVNMRWSVAPGYEDSLAQVLVSTVDITERKQAEQRIQRQIQRLNILRKIDQGITGSAGLGAVLDIILKDGLAELGVDAGVVLLYDPGEQLLKYEQGVGMRTAALQHTQLKLGEGYAGRAALARQTVIISSLRKHNTDFLDSPSFSQEGFACYFGVPLIVKDEIKGVLEIFHRAPLQPEQEWLDFMETLAGQAAIAIDNAQLWQRIQRQNLELEQRVAERTAELEHANRAKDEFLATMSHELRTPLNSILGLSESLLEQRRDPLSERQQGSLRIIESSGRHLLDLINDILDLSKIEAGKLDYYPQVVDVHTLCRTSLAFIKEQAVRKSISLVYPEKHTDLRIHADPRRLKQALVNLLTNAVKFTPEHGQVTLEVHPEPEEDRIHFSVTDTGIGIAEKELKQLFQPFVQVDSSLNRQYEGTGLGLVLVERLTDLHGGSVHVESEPSRGSRFTISIPWRQEEVAWQEILEAGGALPAREVPSKRDGPTRDVTVLLAEDNAANTLTISEYLESCGYRIVNAYDGLDAIEKAATAGPHIILMDIQMPAMDGLEAIRQLRLNPRFDSTPIVALTALAMPGDRERCLQAGADEYMSKPVSLRMLAETIESLLRAGR